MLGCLEIHCSLPSHHQRSHRILHILLLKDRIDLLIELHKSNSPLFQLSPISLYFTPFYSVNTNSKNSNSPLTRTKFPLISLDQNFTEIYLDYSNSGSCYPTLMPFISSSCCMLGKNTKTNATFNWFNERKEKITFFHKNASMSLYLMK